MRTGRVMQSGRAMLQIHRTLLKQILCQAISRRHQSKWSAAPNDPVEPAAIRSLFSKSMSEMYRQEVPQYSTLLELVRSVNEETLGKAGKLEQMSAVELERLNEERHGAIRLGTPEELYNIRRLFAVMGMHPVGYYDLSTAGVPVHSTAFRSLDDYSLNESPFRVFTSLLRLELVEDKELRERSQNILHRRKIFSPALLELIEKFETEKILQADDAKDFITEAIKVFKFNNEITVSVDVYKSLLASHSLVADIVCFKTPHINHLTPSTLDIDRVQESMNAENSRTSSKQSRKPIVPKAVIEGPPRREVPILLRQTSFKALSEDIVAPSRDSSSGVAKHTARFGEVEQRGIALTAKGRQLYDYLLDKTRGSFRGVPDESNSKLYMENLEENFSVFPDDLNTLRKEKLAFFKYYVTEKGKAHLDKNVNDFNLDNFIRCGFISYEPLRYEDFLPVSAAGIFQSNLAGGQTRDETVSNSGSRADFENALGCAVEDEMKLYAERETKSLQDATFYFIR